MQKLYFVLFMRWTFYLVHSMIERMRGHGIMAERKLPKL